MPAPRRGAAAPFGHICCDFRTILPDLAVFAAGLIGASGASAQTVFSRPYINVVRRHLLIFFFAICHALKADSFPDYVVVYAVYFFPWSAFKPSAGGAPADPAAGGAVFSA